MDWDVEVVHEKNANFMRKIFYFMRKMQRQKAHAIECKSNAKIYFEELFFYMM